MAKGKRRATGNQRSGPVTQTLAPARRATRAVERRRRQKKRRTRTSAAVIVSVVMLVVAGVVLIGGAVTRDGSPKKAKVRTQRTVLFEVTGSGGAGRAATLLAYDPGPRRSAMVLIPPSTLADVAGIGNVVLKDALRLGGPTAAREAVADLMGVVVDYDWTLTSEAFAALVDRVGGVVVDVDVDVTTGSGAKTVILLRAGPGQRLDGRTALAYATFVAKGQDEVAFQARLQRVLEAVFTALPGEVASLATSITALGSGSRLSTKPADLAAFLDGFRVAQREDRYEPVVLPVSVIDTGSGVPAFGIKVDEISTLVSSILADSIPPGRDDGNNRVLVLNGVGTPGLGASVARKMRGEFRIVGTRNKQPFGIKESVVVVFDSTDPSLAKGRRVAELLGLGPASVRIGTQQQSVADVIVIIGADYKP